MTDGQENGKNEEGGNQVDLANVSSPVNRAPVMYLPFFLEGGGSWNVGSF